VEERELSERVERLETLLGEIESLDEPGRKTALAAVQALLDLYGEGLTRIVERVAEVDDGTLAAAFAGDELVSHLLVLHDLHPASVEERIARALDEVRPYLQSHGGNVELLGIEEGVARLRLVGSCDGCPSSSMTLRLAVEDAVQKAAPEIERIEAEGVVSEPPSAVIPVASIGRLAPPRQEAARATNGSAWTVAGALRELSSGGAVLKEVSGEQVLFVALDGSFYAYRPLCPGCGDSLAEAALEASELGCMGCGRRFDVRGAGRCLDDPELYIEPIPLLTSETGIVKVALPASAT
jgi:Fe-S cluster biogenesis protein NfuA/nitrite reductase/ring-hydroxylating ferredoxin subunit